MRRLAIGLLAGILTAAAGAASAFVELSGAFVADDRCPAFDSIRRQSNPGGVVLAPGQSYDVRGLNREDGDYVQVEVPGATPRTRWVSRDCGELRETGDSGSEPPGQAGTALLPFFDTVAQPNDPAPPPPALGAFDRAVLEICGAWGSRPSRAAFRAMLDRPALAADVERIYQALGGSILGGRREPAPFKDELAAVWFSEEGFRHVFCGEPSGSTIGGLHYAGRYLQMQEQGWGGLAPRCAKAEIAPPIYTIGVEYRTQSGRRRSACPKGYALNLDAGEILIEATRALKLLLPRAAGKSMCLHRVAEPNERAYFAVFVIKSGAVRTFYPDASPSCDGGRPAATCLCAP
jgi:hypothetical protein